MKKYLAIIVGVLLVVAMAATVYAEITIGGDARVRGVLKRNFDFADTADDVGDADYWDQRVRIKLTAKVAGNAEVRTRFTLIEGVWGNAGNAPFDGTNGQVRFDNDDYAYLHVPVGGVTIDVGRQLANWGNKFLIWATGKNRLKVTYKAGSVKVGGFIDKNVENKASTSTADDPGDRDDYGAFIVNNFGAFKAGLLGVYFIDDDQPSDKDTGVILDVFFTGKVGNLGVAGELAYKGGDKFENNDDPQHGGFIAISSSMDALTIAGAVAYASNGYTANKYFTPTLFFGTSQPTALMNFGSVVDETTYAALLGVNYKVSSALGVMGKIAYADLNGMGVNGDGSIVEIDAGLKYKISKNTTYSIDFAYGIPNDLSVEDDAPIALAHKLEIKF